MSVWESYFVWFWKVKLIKMLTWQPSTTTYCAVIHPRLMFLFSAIIQFVLVLLYVTMSDQDVLMNIAYSGDQKDYITCKT